MKQWLACALVAAFATGCPEIELDEGEGVDDPPTGGPIVEFDPSARIIPFPNNLLLDRSTGKVNLPAQCGETPTAQAIREGVINKLDGFATYQASLTATFTTAVSAESIGTNVVLYKRASGGVAVPAADAMSVSTLLIPSMTTRFDASCANPTAIPQLIIVPLAPLDQKSTYTVGILAGAETATGEALGPSFVWALVRQATNPVTVAADGMTITAENTPLDPLDPADQATLLGIDLLWKAHAQAVGFLEQKGHARNSLLIAWDFNTQTTTDPLDPSVADSLASMIPDGPFTGPPDANGAPRGTAPIPVSLAPGAPGSPARQQYPFLICDQGVPPASVPAEPNPTQCFLKLLTSALAGAAGGPGLACNSAQTCGQSLAAGTQVCARLGCATIGVMYQAGLSSRQYQSEVTNPLAGGRAIPGQFANDPIRPTFVKDEVIEAFIFQPASAAPANGYPTVLFQHGLGQQKSNVFAIAGGLAGAPGFATVAIDAVAHASRAVRINNTGTCADVNGVPPSPLNASPCYAPFLSPDLGATRDNIRQTVLDQLGVIKALKSCSGAACGGFVADDEHIMYAGQSLGGIMGSITAAVSDDVTASVLNVPGVGWVDILENTETLAIRCNLVDGLIRAGILTGDVYNTQGTPDPADDTGLCTTPAWKTQPGYRTFSAIGRWVLDSADPANFAKKLAPRRFMIQQVVGDTVVPNIATENGAKLTGLFAMVGDADPAASASLAPSADVFNDAMTSKYIRYTTLPADAATSFPGNTFSHGSLLSPATSTPDGALATARMQTDAGYFLLVNQ